MIFRIWLFAFIGTYASMDFLWDKITEWLRGIFISKNSPFSAKN